MKYEKHTGRKTEDRHNDMTQWHKTKVRMISRKVLHEEYNEEWIWSMKSIHDEKPRTDTMTWHKDIRQKWEGSL